jgi:hypothetical protein
VAEVRISAAGQTFTWEITEEQASYLASMAFQELGPWQEYREKQEEDR